jgi:hypothetical protein
MVTNIVDSQRPDIATGRRTPSLMAAYIAIACGLGWLFFFTLKTLHVPILDAFGFRQTQTAISVYWMLHEHALIRYLTPVLGSPWSLPFEVPVYQLIVAALGTVTSLDLDACGRIVSVGFFCGTLWCAYLIIRSLLPVHRVAALLFVVAALVSPHIVFWARTFMIESCALFFGMAWLLCAICGTRDRSVPLLVLSIPLCVLCALTKITTWPAFVIGYGIFFGWTVWQKREIPLTAAIIVGGGIVLTSCVVWVWTWHADRVKQLNLLGEYLTSANLSVWVYGTWTQFFSEKLWRDIVPYRMLPQILGYGWPVLLVCFRYIRMNSSYTLLAIACVILFVVPIALFTNLHMVHDYYQTANALFLIAAVTFLFSELIAINKVIPAAAVGTILFAGAVLHVRDNEWPVATGRHDLDPTYIAANIVRSSTPVDSSLIVFGVDWSPQVNYYAERKGLALPGWASLEKAKTILANVDAYMGGLKLESVVDCRSIGQKYSPELNKLIDAFVASWAQQSNHISPAQGSCDVYVKKLYEQRTSPAEEHFPGAAFGSWATLESYSYNRTEDAIALSLRWRAVQPLDPDILVAIHLIDEKGNILAQYDYSRPKLIPAGGTVVEMVTIPQSQLNTAGHRLAIALYTKNGTVAPVDRGSRDWDGHRLVLASPH